MTIIYTKYKRLIASIILGFFVVNSLVPPVNVSAQSLSMTNAVPQVSLTGFRPTNIQGLKLYSDNPLRFDFIIDRGSKKIADDTLKNESSKLIKYFLASLTIPEKDLWVNLSPKEKDRIMPETFSLTEMGRDMLAQDFILKQLSSALTDPRSEVGKKYWKIMNGNEALATSNQYFKQNLDRSRKSGCVCQR